MLKCKHLLLLAAAIAASASCGSATIRNGDSPMYLEITSLQASRGGTSPGPLTTGPLDSDVITNVTAPAPCTDTAPCPTVFGDTGSVTLTASLKNVGAGATPTTPTTNNDVTITQYHVEYVRTDGRNTQGVDVPYAFDGGVTGTISVSAPLSLSFELVQNIAKEQAPLIQLETSSTVISTIANVTFYGHDQVGNQLSVTGSITIDFGNFGDSQ